MRQLQYLKKMINSKKDEGINIKNVWECLNLKTKLVRKIKIKDSKILNKKIKFIFEDITTAFHSHPYYQARIKAKFPSNLRITNKSQYEKYFSQRLASNSGYSSQA